MDDIKTLQRFRAPLGEPDAGVRSRVRARTDELIAQRGLAGGDRTQRRLMRRPLLVLAVAAAIAVSAALAAAESGVLELIGVQQDSTTPVPSSAEAPVRYVLGDQLFGASGGPQQLGAASTGQTAWSDAVPSPDGSTLLYEAANAQGQPGTALRLHDLVSGADQMLAADAFAPVWGADGTIAYGKTEHRQSSGGDLGAEILARVQVRATPTAQPIDWIRTPGAYVPIAWAGKRLLVQQLGVNGQPGSLLALDGPAQTHQLATGWLAALSPDGRQAIVSDGSPDSRPTGPVLRLIDTTNGTIQAVLDLRQASPDGLPWSAAAAAGPGDWSGDSVILPDAAGVLELVVHSNTLSLKKVARFTGDPGIRGAEYHETRFMSHDAHQIIVKAFVLPSSGAGGTMLQSVLVCDLDKKTCVRGGDAGTPDHWLGLVNNPSRPLP